MMVDIYTDGACKGNPGPGGWGALLKCNGKEKTIYGGELLTTNNRMEITAAIKALEALTKRSEVNIFTDSQYLRQGITEWIHNWKIKGWRNSKKEAVKNADLWQRLDSLVSQHTIHWHWVKAHAGHVDNERADALANQGISEMKNKVIHE